MRLSHYKQYIWWCPRTGNIVQSILMLSDYLANIFIWLTTNKYLQPTIQPSCKCKNAFGRYLRNKRPGRHTHTHTHTHTGSLECPLGCNKQLSWTGLLEISLNTSRMRVSSWPPNGVVEDRMFLTRVLMVQLCLMGHN